MMIEQVFSRGALIVALLFLLGACSTQGPHKEATPRVRTPDGAGANRSGVTAAKNPDSGAAAPAEAAGAPESAIDSATGLPLPNEIPFEEAERGNASWYGPRFHGRRTASGERYDQSAFTAAHRTLPFGSVVRVRSVASGKQVEVRINDRGPFVRGRIIDVSRAAAVALGLIGRGVETVLLLKPAGALLLPVDAVPTAARLVN